MKNLRVQFLRLSDNSGSHDFRTVRKSKILSIHGTEGYGIVDQFKTVADSTEFSVILKQLNTNKNEVTIMRLRR